LFKSFQKSYLLFYCSKLSETNFVVFLVIRSAG
jgi:hypothetical protein